jgi:uncharacterized protein (TIGR00730 family)
MSYYEYHNQPITLEELRQAALGLGPIEGRLAYINQELRRGLDLITRYPQSVTVFGSARSLEDNSYYQQARELGKRIVQELDYAVITGGGPGIMEAANRGAKEAGGTSIGVTIRLPKEQHSNEYVTEHVDFYYFFTRKVILSFSALAYVNFPGGYGTLDEVFEILTLVQTHKIPPVPIVLYGTSFWHELDIFIKNQLLTKHETVSPQDPLLYTITDDMDQVMEIIGSASAKAYRDTWASQ